MAKTVGLTIPQEGKDVEKCKCPHCEKEYANSEQLDKHISEKHPKV